MAQRTESEAKQLEQRAAEHASEFAACAADVAYFTHHYGVIDDAQGHGDGSGTMPFHLWPAQCGVLWKFMTERLVLILKARQLGISWLCCSFALWLCLFHPGKVVMLFSKGKMEANELLRRVKVLYERLPDWMREALPNLVTDNTTTLEWDNASRVQSNPATQSAGRSFTASLVILDEAAFLQWATTLYTSMKPVIDGGGQLIVLSTANGIGNLFHRLWTRASKKLNSFCAIFLPWWSRPGRTREWYLSQVDDADDPALVPQEYPANAGEAFVSSGRVRFKGSWIEAQYKNVRPGMAIEQFPAALRELAEECAGPQGHQKQPGLHLYKLPIAGRRYVLAGDVAEGLAHGDYSAAVLLDAQTLEEIAFLHGHWEPGEYAQFLAILGVGYDAEIAVERNNHGHAVLLALTLLGYGKIVCADDERPGWLTTNKTKPIIIGNLAAALRDALLTIRSQPALDEMQIYQKLKNGGTGAPDGYCDDIVMAWAIAITIAQFPPLAEDEETEEFDSEVSISAF